MTLSRKIGSTLLWLLATACSKSPAVLGVQFHVDQNICGQGPHVHPPAERIGVVEACWLDASRLYVTAFVSMTGGDTVKERFAGFEVDGDTITLYYQRHEMTGDVRVACAFTPQLEFTLSHLKHRPWQIVVDELRPKTFFESIQGFLGFNTSPRRLVAGGPPEEQCVFDELQIDTDHINRISDGAREEEPSATHDLGIPKDQLTVEDIVQGVKAHARMVKPCLSNARQSRELGPGRYKLILDWTIRSDGSTVDAKMTGPRDLMETSLPKCMEKAMSGWRFRPSKRGAPVKNFPFGPFNVK